MSPPHTCVLFGHANRTPSRCSASLVVWTRVSPSLEHRHIDNVPKANAHLLISAPADNDITHNYLCTLINCIMFAYDRGLFLLNNNWDNAACGSNVQYIITWSIRTLIRLSSCCKLRNSFIKLSKHTHFNDFRNLHQESMSLLPRMHYGTRVNVKDEQIAKSSYQCYKADDWSMIIYDKFVKLI